MSSAWRRGSTASIIRRHWLKYWLSHGGSGGSGELAMDLTASSVSSSSLAGRAVKSKSAVESFGDSVTIVTFGMQSPIFLPSISVSIRFFPRIVCCTPALRHDGFEQPAGWPFVVRHGLDVSQELGVRRRCAG